MSAKIIPIITVLALDLFLVTSCEDTTFKEYKGYAPVYLSYEDLRTSVSLQQNVNLTNPGKIYFKDNFIFIVEEMKGIHVYDNSNPLNPVNKVFVNLPGVVDISISGNILYADSYVDLVAFDVQSIENIHEVGRVKNILPYTVPKVENDFPQGNIDQDKGVVTGWDLRTIKEKVNQNQNIYPVYSTDLASASNSYAGGASSSISSSGVGVGGSMARFGIKGNVLYVVETSTLKVFDITDKINPVKQFEISPGWNVETMFLTDDKMFLGTTTGMVIYDLSTPLYPQYVTLFSHARSCDPVIIDDTLAYVTLRTGTTCGSSQNTLNVVNVKNIKSPSLVAAYPMNNPYGLGKKGDILFICDGSAGLKIYDASDPNTISSHLIYTYSNINTYDVIPIGNLLILIGDSGLFEYDYSDIKNISLLSSIVVTAKK
jgi:hypothetical protein